MSTESGIPDFRSVDGLYHQRYPYPPEASPNAAHLYRGGRLALINKSPTPYDKRAGLVISAPIGKVLGAIQVR